MKSKMVEEIKRQMNERSSEELAAMWRKNDRSEWSDEAFEAITLILKDRGVTPPTQNVPPDVQRNLDVTEQLNHSRPLSERSGVVLPHNQRRMFFFLFGLACALFVAFFVATAVQSWRVGANVPVSGWTFLPLGASVLCMLLAFLQIGISAARQSAQVRAPKGGNIMNDTVSSQTGQQHRCSDDRIRPSPTGFVFGLGACLIGAVLGIRVIIMIEPLMRSRNAVEVGGNLGGVVVLTLIASAIFKWGVSRLRSTTVKEAVQELHDKSADKRQTAANALIRARWMPTTETQQLDLLIAGEKWQKAVEVGSSGVTRVVDTLTWEGSFLPPKLDALEQSKSPLAVKPLIDILGHSASSGFRGNVVKTLRQLTGKDFGKNMKEWLDWYEQTHNVLTPDRSEAQHTSPGDVANRAAPEK